MDLFFRERLVEPIVSIRPFYVSVFPGSSFGNSKCDIFQNQLLIVLLCIVGFFSKSVTTFRLLIPSEKERWFFQCIAFFFVNICNIGKASPGAGLFLYNNLIEALYIFLPVNTLLCRFSNSFCETGIMRNNRLVQIRNFKIISSLFSLHD
jgi:hypothetical protein